VDPILLRQARLINITPYTCIVVQKHLDYFDGQLDTQLSCNYGNQDTVSEITEISSKHLLDTFDTKIYLSFYITKAVIPHLERSPAMQLKIAFNNSINLFKGHLGLVDYTTTKGAILSLSRPRNTQLTGKAGIRELYI
jgi:NAD(P)-dependent dehydrogenase (short-subunit alcohol dehydrogenase family)